MTSAFPYAAPAYVLRAANKDEYCVRHLTTLLQDAASKVMGPRFTNTNEEWITRLGAFLYVAVSTVRGRQTIGEEYADLLSVSGSPARPLSDARRVLLAAATALLPLALRRAAQRLFPRASPDEVTDHASRLHLMVFCLFGAYASAERRLLSVRHLALRPPRGGGGDSTAAIGVLMLAEFAARAVGALKAWGSSRRGVGNGSFGGLGGSGRGGSPGTAAGGGLRSGYCSDDEEGDPAAGRCTLCLGSRRAPTATSCGHVFCWECIAHWCTANRPSLCPLCRQSVSAESLVALSSYVAPTSS